jgi:hypothetical protein
MARSKTRPTRGIVLDQLKRAEVAPGPQPPEAALCNLAICEMFSISKQTLKRWRETLAFPSPDFVITNREFVWHSRIIAWTKAQGTQHPQRGQRPVTTPEAA